MVIQPLRGRRECTERHENGELDESFNPWGIDASVMEISDIVHLYEQAFRLHRVR